MRVGVVRREKLSFPVILSLRVLFYFIFGSVRKIFLGYESEKREGEKKEKQSVGD